MTPARRARLSPMPPPFAALAASAARAAGSARAGWRRLGLARLLALALCLPAALAAAAEEEPRLPPDEERASSPFAETIEVNVVNVDVYVTDGKGNRVSGLERDDFELYEDRRPVAITNFYAVEGGRVADPPPTATGPAPAPGLPPAAAPVPAEQRLYLVVYVDNFNLRPFNRNRVFRRVREFLVEQVDPGDQVMLVSYDRSLNVRQEFTGDANAVVAQLFELETVTGHAVLRDSERREVVELMDQAEDWTEVSMRLRSYAESAYNDLSFTVDALREVVDWLAGLPGRKAILYVSDGLPMVPGQELFYALQQKFSDFSSLSETNTYDATRRFQELASQANSNRVSFYTVDAAGLRVYSSSSAANTGLSSPGMSSFLDSMEISNLQSSLLYLADATGGLAIINTNDVGDGLGRVADDFDNYYSLGYSPAHGVEGRAHKLEVKVKRKGLQVRHRENYRDRSLETRISDSTLATLRFGFEDNPLNVGVQFGEATRKDDGFWLVPIIVQIPLDKVTLLPFGDAHEARLRLFVAALDEEGGTSPVAQQPVPVRIPTGELDDARGQLFRYELSLLMRGGPHFVAVGLRDDSAAAVSYVRRSVWVGS